MWVSILVSQTKEKQYAVNVSVGMFFKYYDQINWIRRPLHVARMQGIRNSSKIFGLKA